MKGFIVYILFFVGSVSAQTINDAGAWFTLNASHELKNNYSLLLTQEFRLRENLSAPNLTYTDVGLQYNPKGPLKVALVYRFVQKYFFDNPVSFRNRIMCDVTYKKKFTRSSFQIRSRIQAEVKNYFTSRNGKMTEWFWRNKFAYKYELNKRLFPYASLELRCQLNDPRNPEYNMQWHRVRYQFGCDYKLGTKQAIGAYYLIQNEFGLKTIQNQYIIGLEFSLEI